MTIGSNLYPANYPKLPPVPTYGCPDLNSTLTEPNNITFLPVNATSTRDFDRRLIDDKALPFYAENSTLVPADGQSKDDVYVLSSPSILIC